MREIVSTTTAPLNPLAYFENASLRSTALKLAAIVESAQGADLGYFDALGLVLVHEVMRLARGLPRIDAPVQGGLAAWQQRIAVEYIREHLAEPIQISTLAKLVRLSPYYFCRAFKQSLGIPPHKFHTCRRIDQAKSFLAEASLSVTEIALLVGFNETSSFTAAFRKATGITPTAYRRSLG